MFYVIPTGGAANISFPWSKQCDPLLVLAGKDLHRHHMAIPEPGEGNERLTKNQQGRSSRQWIQSHTKTRPNGAPLAVRASKTGQGLDVLYRRRSYVVIPGSHNGVAGLVMINISSVHDLDKKHSIGLR